MNYPITINITDLEPKPWDRTVVTGHYRLLSKKLRNYYRELYYAISHEFDKRHIKPKKYRTRWFYLDPDVELKLSVMFHRTTRIRVDTDNLVKALMDSGHPGKWGVKNEKLLPNLWEDWVFYDLHPIRRMGQKEPYIGITIERETDVTEN